MENNQNSNWTTPNPSGMGMGQEIPNATLSMVLGIIGLFLSLCAGCGPVGFVASIIAYIKGKAAVKEFDANPSAYSEKSYQQAKAGKIMGLIGLILGIIAIVILVIAFVTGMLAEIMKK